MTVTLVSRFVADPAGRLSWPGGGAWCVFGRSGCVPAETKREGDGATPLGDWPMRQVFWRPDRTTRPTTHLPTTALTPDMGWCDDPGANDYNRLVRLPYPHRCETLWREDHVYDLIVVLGFNDDPPIAGHGSAIFLHLAQPDGRPTEGCVATDEHALRTLLAATGAGDRLLIASSETGLAPAQANR